MTVSSTVESVQEEQVFQFKDGRRFHNHKDASYVLPNDNNENARLKMQHDILKLFHQTNFFAPINDKLKEGIAVLDSACGPAHWTVDMAETYPNSKFYGVDMSNVFPSDSKPTNTEFVIGNITKRIPFPDNTFDYIHQRLLVLGFTNDDWNANLKELFRVLKPGGYLELAEFEFEEFENMGPLYSKLKFTMADILKSRGLVPSVGRELKDRLTKAGFIRVEALVNPLPINHTSKEVGTLNWLNVRHCYMNCHPALTKFHPEWEDIKVFQDYVEKCGEESKVYKTNNQFYSSYARKPLEQ